LKVLLTSFPELQEPALQYILELREPFTSGDKEAIQEAMTHIHRPIAEALERLGEKGILADWRYDAEKGYLVVLLKHEA